MAYTAPSGTIRTGYDAAVNAGIEMRWYVSKHGRNAYGNTYYEIAADFYLYGTADAAVDYIRVNLNGDGFKAHGPYLENMTYSPGDHIGTAILGTVRHAVEETASTSITFAIQTYSTNSQPISVTGTGTATLPAFKQYMSIATCPAQTIGNEVAVNVTKKSSKYKVDVYYEIGAASAILVEGHTGSSFDWLIPDSLHNEVTTSTRGVGYLITHTYNGSELIDISHFPLVVLVDQEKCKPTLAPTAKFINYSSLTGSENIVIPYAPNGAIDYAANVTTKYGATVSKCLVRNSGLYLETQTGRFSKPTHNGVYFSITDSRGLVAHAEVILDIVDYVLPTAHVTVGTTSADSVELTITGTYWAGDFGAAENAITLTVFYEAEKLYYYSNHFEVDTSNIYFDTETHTYTATATITGLDNTKTYAVTAKIQDKIVSSVYADSVLAVLRPVFDWSKTDFNFNVPVAMQDDLEVKGNVTIGGDLNIAGSITANGIPLLAQGLDAGEWTPVCNSCTPITAKGSYLRVGQMAVITFFYQGTGNIETQSANLYFSGLPFTPDDSVRWYAGGGNCTGWVPNAGSLMSNLTFTSWSIEGALIYGRSNQMGSTQQAAALSSAYISAVKNATLYASGTIMYKIKDGE